MLIFSLFLLQNDNSDEMVCSSTFKPFKGTGGNHFEFFYGVSKIMRLLTVLLKTLFNVVLCPLRFKGIGKLFQHFSCCIPLYNVYIVWFSRNGNKMTYF